MQQAGVIDPAPVPGAGGVGTTAGASSGAPQERPAAAFSVLSNERGTEVEDTFVLMDDLNLEVPAALRKAGVQCSAPTVRLFGVYDGHGGNGVAAKHCARRLHYFVAEQLQAILRRHAAETPVVTEVCPLDTPVVVGALREAFVATDAELKASGVLEHSSGSTAVVALLTRASIWLAWAGDSRAVLVRGGEAVAATDDHRPAHREDEKRRIEQAGGMLLNNCGLRLMGMLATTRAIGDHDLQPYGLTPVPEVMRLQRMPDDEFLVLASDGLWDKVAPQEAANFAHSAWQRFSDRTIFRGSSGASSSGGSADISEVAAATLTSPVTSPKASLAAPAALPILPLCSSSSNVAEAPAPPSAAAAAAAPTAPSGAAAVPPLSPPAAPCSPTATCPPAAHGTHQAAAAPPAAALKGRTCRACKAARIAAAAMTKCARSRRSRDDTTVVVVNLQQACRCAQSWATVSGVQPSAAEEGLLSNQSSMGSGAFSVPDGCTASSAFGGLGSGDVGSSTIGAAANSLMRLSVGEPKSRPPFAPPITWNGQGVEMFSSVTMAAGTTIPGLLHTQQLQQQHQQHQQQQPLPQQYQQQPASSGGRQALQVDLQFAAMTAAAADGLTASSPFAVAAQSLPVALPLQLNHQGAMPRSPAPCAVPLAQPLSTPLLSQGHVPPVPSGTCPGLAGSIKATPDEAPTSSKTASCSGPSDAFAVAMSQGLGSDAASVSHAEHGAAKGGLPDAGLGSSSLESSQALPGGGSNSSVEQAACSVASGSPSSEQVGWG